MIRVLRLDQNDPIVWQRALLTSEAEEVAFRFISGSTLCSFSAPA